MSEYDHLNAALKGELSKHAEKRRKLRELDLFVLDNSLRESTVGQIRAHTLDNKWAILDEIKKCGYDHIIVASFSHMTRVDDAFVSKLSEREGDMSKFFAFSEIREKGSPEKLPVGLDKMIQYGVPNPIFEIDLANFTCQEDVREMRQLLKRRFKDTRKRFSDAKILVNLRDLAVSMIKHPNYVFNIVKYLSNKKPHKRIFGIVFEEPMGKFLPEQLGAWTKVIRMLMDEYNWQSGHLLVHIHKKWELGEASVQECLSNGANGVWASVAEEGAGMGHACSIVTVMNLIRTGNKKVLKKFNCIAMRQAAINITKITTGELPPPKQTIYGERALDTVFDLGSGMGGQSEFSLADFYGVESPNRITTLASEKMIVERLVKLFDKNEQFTLEMAKNMKKVMLKDLTSGHKEEYMTPVGLAVLFDSAGGKLTPKMSEMIQKVKVKSEAHKLLIQEVRETWDMWDISEGRCGDNRLEFYSFYNGFMAPYFGCYECEDSKKGLKALDMDSDGGIDWEEFMVYLKWALNQYPDIATSEELLKIAFTRALIPAMQDAIVKQNKEAQSSSGGGDACSGGSSGTSWYPGANYWDYFDY